MQFTYRIEIDDDYTSWGDPEVVAEETRKIADHEWAPYVVTVRAAGPIDASQELTGCVVPFTDTGNYHDVDAIQDPHLRSTAAELATKIEAGYLDKLTAKRDEINAMIQQMGGA